MSVLKKIQFADTSMIGVAEWMIIGAGATECQKYVREPDDHRIPPCSIVAH
jgi:hypothetical protein